MGFFGTCIFGDKTLQLPLHISKLIMNAQYLNSTGFKSKIVGITMHGLSFKDRHFVAKELLKLSNTAEHYFRLLLIFKFLWMFNISDLSIEW